MQGWLRPKVELLFSIDRGVGRHCIGVLGVVAMIFRNFLLHLPSSSSSNEYLPTKGAFRTCLI
jgi:hypothetical protein